MSAAPAIPTTTSGIEALPMTLPRLFEKKRTGEPIVSFKMNAASARAFTDLTTKSVGKPMEFRVDGRVIMKPVIREPILGVTGQISGSFSVDEAKALAERLASGAAKLELEVVE